MLQKVTLWPGRNGVERYDTERAAPTATGKRLLIGMHPLRENVETAVPAHEGPVLIFVEEHRMHPEIQWLQALGRLDDTRFIRTRESLPIPVETWLPWRRAMKAISTYTPVRISLFGGCYWPSDDNMGCLGGLEYHLKRAGFATDVNHAATYIR